ncbi:MAG: FGGY-family carbohydrate kinase [Treponema sp.]|nr:FGGY-family carbohydrate kinase [Treponema sp.]MCL2272670.1 FGGY-family carbohydrate kinase [Treponema sp.]
MQNQNPVILTIDLGTQSVRAILVDRNGNILNKTQNNYEKPYYSLNPGWAEQKPDVYWSAVCDVTNRLKNEAKETWNNIIAVTITTIRDTCLCVTKDGQPLRDVIVWLDKRQCNMKKPFPALHSSLYRLTGMTDTAELQRKVSACNWIMENEPDVWKKTYKFIFISGYLTYLLTGRFADSVANMVGHIPFNSKTRKWMSKSDLNRPIFDIELEKLTDVLEPGKTIGYITETASSITGIPKGLPLIATGSDIGCQTVGLSCLKPDSAAINFGTTATIQFTIDKYMEPLPFIPAYPAVLEKHYNPEVQVYRGYWLISWFKKEFAQKEVERAREIGVMPEAILEKMLKGIPPGCDGLVFQPYFTPGVVMPKSKGSIIGFSDIHTRAHIYRAIIEGINFALMDGLYTMEKRGKVKIKKLFLAGGGSQSDVICQITADMFGIPAYRTQTYEASGIGSAMVAFAAMKVHKDIHEAAAKMVRIKDEFLPDLKIHEIYKFLFNDVFSKVFDKLLPLYKSYEEHINVKTV